jgi:hypothetical protein
VVYTIVGLILALMAHRATISSEFYRLGSIVILLSSWDQVQELRIGGGLFLMDL